MISAKDCRAYSADCVTQRMESHISAQCATMLMAMARNWAVLADQTDQYNDYVTEHDVGLGPTPKPTQ
jgi:hypothetical protein